MNFKNMYPSGEKNKKTICSERLYLFINRKDIAYLRFILESHHNLAYVSILDKYQAVAQLRFAPEQTREVFFFLKGLEKEIDIQVLDLNSSHRED